MSAGPAPFYQLQDLHEAQADPVQFDQQPMGPAPTAEGMPMGAPSPAAQYASAFAQPWAQPFQMPGMMGAQTPQPPVYGQVNQTLVPQGPVQTPPPTGDVTMGIPDLQTRMQQYLAMTKAVYDKQKLPMYGANIPHPSAVAQFFSMGQLGHEWAARASQYDLGAQQHNAQLDEKASLEALRLMQADHAMQLAERRLAATQNDVGTKAINEQLNMILKTMNIERMQRQAQMDPGAPPLTPSPTPTGGAPGEPAGASPYTPPAPGSPLGGTAAGGAPPPSAATPAAPQSTQPQPGENMYQFSQRRKAEIAAGVKAAQPTQATAATRTMRETTGSVLDLAQQVEDDLKNVSTGPLSSRTQEFTTGTLGMANPAWAKYRTDAGLLATALMRMHVGARGGGGMLEHFKGMFDVGTQSGENITASIEQAKKYARYVASGGTGIHTPAELATIEDPTTTTPTAPPETGAAGTSIEDILSKHGY